MAADLSDPLVPPAQASAEGESPRHLLGFWFAAFLLAIGIVVFVSGLSYGVGGEDEMIGPGAAPAALGALLIIGAAVVMSSDARAWRRRPRAEWSGGDDASKREREGSAGLVSGYARKAVLRPVVIIVTIGLGFGLSSVIGVIPSMTLTVVVLAVVVERLRIVPALIMGAVSAIIMWLIFVQLLSVRFPPSLLGI